MVAVVIRIPEAVNNKLREYAAKVGYSYQDLILFAIVRYLEVVGISMGCCEFPGPYRCIHGLIKCPRRNCM